MSRSTELRLYSLEEDLYGVTLRATPFSSTSPSIVLPFVLKKSLMGLILDSSLPDVVEHLGGKLSSKPEKMTHEEPNAKLTEKVL